MSFTFLFASGKGGVGKSALSASLAALLARSVTEAEVIAFPDLGTEAIRRLTVSAFPAIVLIDSLGNSLYETGPALYRAE